MKYTRLFGILLIVVGILGLALGQISWTDTDQVDLGPIEVETEHEEGIPLPPLASGAAVVAGIVLVVVSSRKST